MGTGVLVVDDCPTTRLGVSAVLDGEGNLSVVGDTGDPSAALCLARELRPGLVVQELGYPGSGAPGARLCKDLKGMPRAPRVLFHTARNAHQDVYSCYLAGADGFVHKTEEPDRLADAARQVLSGRRVWLLGRDPANPPFAGSTATVPEECLTEKEQEVLALMLQGHPNGCIAEELCVSLATVKTHAGSVFRKLGVSGREGLYRTR